MKSYKDLLTEATKGPSKAILNRVKKVNGYIERALKDEVYGIEPDSTWESAYEFEPIEIKGNFIYFKWKEPYDWTSKGKIKKERYSLTNELHEDDIKYMFSWITKSLKKGYKQEGKSFKA
jgi:hypothetical protein